jgi:hypothetical protein
MNEYNKCVVTGLDRSFRLAITDIERIRLLRNLIEATKQRLASLEKDPDKNADNIIQERTMLNACKRAAHKLEQIVLFFEEQ